jgi:Conserved region in glutamate synthase
MLETGIWPDFIVVDGAEGVTGAGPLELLDHTGMPLREGLMFVHNALVGLTMTTSAEREIGRALSLKNPRNLRITIFSNNRDYRAISLPWRRIVSKFSVVVALLGLAGVTVSASAQFSDPRVGRHLAETVCSACHQIEAYSQGPGPNPKAPNFVDISHMSSMTELAIKVFLSSPIPRQQFVGLLR